MLQPGLSQSLQEADKNVVVSGKFYVLLKAQFSLGFQGQGNMVAADI